MHNLVDNQERTFKEVLLGQGNLTSHRHFAFASGYLYLSGLRELAELLDRVALARAKNDNLTLRVLMGRQTDSETRVAVKLMNRAERRLEAEGTLRANLEKELVEEDTFGPEVEEGPTKDFMTTLLALMKPDGGGFRGLEIRVLPDQVLHAKAYLFSDEKPAPGEGLQKTHMGNGYALAGSANLTRQGLTTNLELGLGSKNATEVVAMSAWFERLWEKAEPVNDTLLDEVSTLWPLSQPSLEDLFLRMQYLLIKDELEAPPVFDGDAIQLTQFQLESVAEARQRIEAYGGVMLSHVVGLGKTYMGAKLLKVLSRQHGIRQIVVFCPKSVTQEWIEALKSFKVFDSPESARARVISVDMVGQHPSLEEIEEGATDTLFTERVTKAGVQTWNGELVSMAELVLVDESHRLRNSSATTYQNMKRILENVQGRARRLSVNAPTGGGVIFCTATPMAKEAVDLFRQLELFWKQRWIPGTDLDWDQAVKVVQKEEADPAPKDQEPEVEPVQPPLHHPDALLPVQERLKERPRDSIKDRIVEAVRNAFMVRRTRGNVARKDDTGRSFVLVGKDHRLYFPQRALRTLRVGFFSGNESQYDDVLTAIGERGEDPVPGISLAFAAFDLLEYLHRESPRGPLDEARLTKLGATAEDLRWYRNRNVGPRLRGAMRSLLFKRLDSSPYALYMTLSRMTARVKFMQDQLGEAQLPLPTAKELRAFFANLELEDDPFFEFKTTKPSTHFDLKRLKKDLDSDLQILESLMDGLKDYRPNNAKVAEEWDLKLRALIGILNGKKDYLPKGELSRLEKALNGKNLKDAKILIFTQYADTVTYLDGVLRSTLKPDRALSFLAVTSSTDLYSAKGRFSPSTMSPAWDEARLQEHGGRVDILLATDRLSEGSNLQEAQVVINYDLPWAPHTLIQRVGRVDRLKSGHEVVLQINFLVDTHIEGQLNLEALVKRRMEQIHRHIGEDSKVVHESETLNERALRLILSENPEGLESLDPDDHRFSRPNMVRFFRDLKERDPERLERIQSMRLHHRAAYGSDDASRLAGAVMVAVPGKDRKELTHPPRLVHPPLDGRYLLESEAMELIQPTTSASIEAWSRAHWADLAKVMGAAKLPTSVRTSGAKDELLAKWRKLLRRAEDHQVLDPVFSELLKDQWSRWSDLRKDEAERFKLPPVKEKAFPVEDPEAWKAAWEPWMERFQEIARGSEESDSREIAAATDKSILGVALVPVIEAKTTE